MISIKNNFIFIHIPKTAGKTVANRIPDAVAPKSFLEHRNYKHLGRFCAHASALELKKDLDSEFWNNSFKFTFVRNPWDRAVSEYLWRQRFKKTRVYYNNFEDFIYALKNGWDYKEDDKRHIEPQYLQITDENGELLINKIFKFENFEKDFKELAKLLNIENYQMNKLNSSKRKRHYSSYYNNKLIKLVEDIYKKDIEMFNYEFETRSLWQDISSFIGKYNL